MRKGELTTADDVDKFLNKRSGMLGVTEITSDNQEIGNLAAEGNERCKLVVEMYKHQIAKYVGSYITCMGGTDAIVFTGGIGENAGEYRSAVCEKLAFMGVKIDEEKNKIRGEEVEISTPDSTIKVYVLPTNEQLMIARDTLQIVNGLK
jgi:acetate kinase